MLNVGRLRVLKEVGYRGSLSAAAAALDYSQSAVSQQISALEAETGMKLLERLPRGVTLTAAGQTLMAHTEAILSRIEAAETALSAIAGLRGGRLRAASFPTAGAALMPLAIASFRAQYPGVALILELALSAVRDDITIRALSPTPPRRRVIAALPESARLVPAAPAMLGILQATAASYAASPRDVAA